ncbi:MAG: hypothetical protein QXG00_05305 [Candidatus Woesearchaeota archaeon]
MFLEVMINKEKNKKMINKMSKMLGLIAGSLATLYASIFVSRSSNPLGDVEIKTAIAEKSFYVSQLYKGEVVLNENKFRDYIPNFKPTFGQYLNDFMYRNQIKLAPLDALIQETDGFRLEDEDVYVLEGTEFKFKDFKANGKPDIFPKCSKK